MHASTAYVTPPSRIRAATFVVLGVCVAALLAAVVLAVVTASAAALARPFSPSAADGMIPEGATVTADDASLPAVARQYVARAEDSTHVTGAAVDIGSPTAQEWLAERGPEWGLCRTYANEPWHFERAASPGPRARPRSPTRRCRGTDRRGVRRARHQPPRVGVCPSRASSGIAISARTPRSRTGRSSSRPTSARIAAITGSRSEVCGMRRVKVLVRKGA